MASLTRLTPRLPVVELERTIDFYTRRLGFAIDVLWPETRPTFAILCRDAASVAFFERDDPEPAPVRSDPEPAPARGAELYIETDDVRAVYESVDGAVSVEWGPEVYSYGRLEFGLRDPDGYLVIFTEPTDEPPTTGEPGG